MLGVGGNMQMSYHTIVFKDTECITVTVDLGAYITMLIFQDRDVRNILALPHLCKSTFFFFEDQKFQSGL